MDPKVLPELPRELWIEIIGMAVATPLTNPDFLVSCVFHEELPIYRQLKILTRNLVCLTCYLRIYLKALMQRHDSNDDIEL